LGVGIAAVSPIFTQGTIEASRVATHVAIQGNGFFMLNGPEGPSYTRAGSFSFDPNGTLVTADGQEVQGFTTMDPVTKQVVTTGSPTSINVPPGVLRPPVSTSQFSAISNLNSQAAVGDTFTTSFEIFDTLSAKHLVTMTYTNTGPGAWTYSLTADGGEVTGGTAGTPAVIGSGTLGFDGSGVLTDVDSAPPANVSITTPTWTNGALASTLQWKVIDANGNPMLTSFASPSATSSISQNGMAAGTVTDISINAAGEILATLGAGQSLVVGQLAIAGFNNPQGLTKIGSNRYGEGAAAGMKNVGTAGTGGRGTLVGNALEQSNVDMAQEFTLMILAQRGYQANGKMITVSDQLLLETLQLKQ
jgi:flagellar hook protein FlgE